MTSELDLTLFGSYYAARLTGTSVGAALPVENTPEPKRPELGQVDSKNGGDVLNLMPWGGAWLCGYGQRPPSCPASYLSALLDPVLAAARMFAQNPIKVGKAKLVARDGAKDEWKKVAETTERLLGTYVEDALWAVDMGWAGFQEVWDRDGGRFVVKQLIACRQEADSGVLVDKNTGNKAGLRWNGVDLYGHKQFVYTHDRRGQQWLGRSRLENVLDQIEKFRQNDEMLGKMGRKASGIVIMTGYPPGKDITHRDANKTMADSFGKAITSGAAYGSYPTLGGLTDDKIRQMSPADLVKFLELSLWQFKNIDLGNPGPAMVAMVEYQKYLDALKCHGYGVPPEAILQGIGGNLAKTTSQSNSGTAMNENVNRGLYQAFNDGPLNSTLELNFGPAARDSFQWEPEPLEDEQSVFDREILKMIAQSDGGMDYLARNFELDAIAERNGLPKRETPLPPGVITLPVPGANGAMKPNGQQQPGQNGQANGVEFKSQRIQAALNRLP